MSFPLSNDSIDSNESKGDSIGDTVFSKHWLFKCLLNTIKLINGESEDSEKSESVSSERRDSSDRPLVELDSEAEEELSILWDMSANEEVMVFLNDLKAIDLFEAIIVKTNSPRFAEISAGILANIANNHSICVTLANKQGFRDLILSLLESSDTPFLIQLIRLMSTSVSNIEVQSLWMTSIKSNSTQFFSTIQYTLENCLNCDLLKAMFVLINKILYIEDSLCIEWLRIDEQNECVKCLLQASHQLISDDIENIEYFDYLWLILHSLSLSSQQFLSKHINCSENEILVLFDRYIMSSFGDSVDYIITSAHRAGSLSAAISLCNQIITSLSLRSQKTLSNNNQLIDCLNLLLINCDQSLRQMSSNSESFQLALDELKAVLQLLNNNRTLHDIEIPQTR